MKNIIHSFKRILIANRGEIAVRIMKTAKKIGIETVAIYTKEEKESLHVQKADFKALLKGDNLNETYLNANQIIEIAQNFMVDAIHPGYGFLSENSNFASLCIENNISFIGPSPENIRIMGSKTTANQIARDCQVPLLNKLEGSSEEILRNISSLQFPVIIKASAGGGGKGMRIVDTYDQLVNELEKAGNEAERYFKDNTIYVEEYIKSPRHIEIQILADQYGNVLHLHDRECSIHRRYQKVVEEAPAPNLNVDLKETMVADAIKLANHIGYSSAGTIEFLVTQEGKHYFLEMNTRIQVEHPVTEEITGIDLIEKQIRIAEGKTLKIQQQDITINGHAIEVRIYAEDPFNNFQPSSGNIKGVHLPSHPHIRIDGGSKKSENINPSFDPLLKKITSWGKNRQESLDRLQNFMIDYALFGVTTNRELIIRTIMHPDFASGNYSTSFFDKHSKQLLEDLTESEKELELFGIIYILLKEQYKINEDNIWNTMGYWRQSDNYNLILNKNFINLRKVGFMSNKLLIKNEKTDSFILTESIYLSKDKLTFSIQEKKYKAYYLFTNNEFHIQFNGKKRIVKNWETPQKSKARQNENMANTLKAPIPGKILDIMVKEGQIIEKGSPLVILEAMKTENYLNAWKTTKVVKIPIQKGEQVALDQLLIETE